MGTWTLWIAFHVAIALLLLLDFGLFHRRPHEISMLEAAVESSVWISLSVGFGLWIYFSHGSGPGLEFFTGYVIEKSLSVDNVFLFLLIFRFFRVDLRYQYKLLFWGVLGALALRGAMIGLGIILIHKLAWILYLFGAFLLYAGFRLFSAKHSVNPDKNPIARWAKQFLPMSDSVRGPEFFVREGGRWLATPLFLAAIVIETTDLIFAVDSIPAVFGVTHDPFLVYTSNVCAILGLRALYFLLAGILPYFKYLDEGLAVVLLFIGGKMLAEPWVHISTGLSLAIVGGVIAAAVIISIGAVGSGGIIMEDARKGGQIEPRPGNAVNHIQGLADPKPGIRIQAAEYFFREGADRISSWLDRLCADKEFRDLLVLDQFNPPGGKSIQSPKLTVGIAVLPETFDKIHKANGSPIAIAPPDQDVVEFELEFAGDRNEHLRLDILTTNALGGNGAIARFLAKFGEGIQQVEIDVTNVDRATEILRSNFSIEPVFPATRAGANGTRVNFFLLTTGGSKKVLVELVEQPKGLQQSPTTHH